MIPIPKPEDFDVSSENGFLPTQPPLEALPDSYYEPWEYVVKNLQGLILSKRLREVVDRLPVLSTERLFGEPQWRRAYSVLAFISHAYVWGGKRPAERVPPTISIPFLETCDHLELPPVATYAGLVLWNWKPIFDTEQVDTLANLDMIDTFTGSLDEKWFYLVSVAIEAKGGALIPLMLHAIQAASSGDNKTVTQCLRTFAERLDEIGSTLTRMYDECDPHVFYHRIRPFLAGSKNMADAGLPNGVIFDDGGPMNKQRYVQFSGGSNAQSSIIQFFDLVLSVEHRPTGEKKTSAGADSEEPKKKAAPKSNFIHEMRKYMPGAHARFLEAVGAVANIRGFVYSQPHDRELSVAFDACIAMLAELRNKHIEMVSRYIIIKSRQAKKEQESADAEKTKGTMRINLATRPKTQDGKNGAGERKDLKGTGGSSLIPFLQQARNETGEPAVAAWSRRLLTRRRGGKVDEAENGTGDRCQGLAGVWKVDENVGGLCLH